MENYYLVILLKNLRPMGTSKNPNFKLLFLGKSVFGEVFAYFYLLYFLF